MVNRVGGQVFPEKTREQKKADRDARKAAQQGVQLVRPIGTDVSRNVDVNSLTPDQRDAIALEGQLRTQGQNNLLVSKIQDKLINEQLANNQQNSQSQPNQPTQSVETQPPTQIPQASQAQVPEFQQPQQNQNLITDAFFSGMSEFINGNTPITASLRTGIQGIPEGNFKKVSTTAVDTLSSLSSAFTKLIWGRTAKGLGLTSDWNKVVGDAKDNLTSNIAFIDNEIQAVQLGLITPQEALANINIYRGNIQQQQSAMQYYLRQDSVKFVAGGNDLLTKYDTYLRPNGIIDQKIRILQVQQARSNLGFR